MVGSEGTEEEDNDDCQGEDVCSVVVFLAGGLFGRAEELRPY